MYEINTTAPLPIVPADILDRFHVNEAYDTRFASGARLLQSIWRERRGLPVGKIKPEKGRRRSLGSRLTPDVARTGVNFLTPEIAKLARREAAYREYGAFIEEERLWGNLLSSQPLVFNLFGRAKLDRSLGTKLFRALLPDFVAELETIHFETSPGRRDERYTGDNTAFDLLATVTTPRGTRGFIGIEVKFVESMKYRARPMTRRVDQLADQAHLYRDPRAIALRDVPLEQLFRQHLLATTIIAHNGPYQEGMFVLVAPEANRDVARAAEAYRGHLREEHAATVPFRQVSMESCIKAIGEAGDPELSAALHERYLDYEPVHAGMRRAMPRIMYKDHRGNRLPSVTTIIGRFKESGGLLYWANQQGLEGKTLDQARMEVTTPGTLAHRAVEDHINGRPETALSGEGDIVEKARSAYAAYLHWESINRITFRHTEVSLASEKHAFGGTMDAVGMIGNALVLLDWKCANAVYADYLYQLAAYGMLWNENYPEHPLVGGFHLCRFAKEQGDFSHHYFPSLADEAATFLLMRELFNRVKKAERRVR